MIETRFFKPEDHYEMVGEWWKAQKWPVLPLTHLSSIGAVAYVDGVPVVAGWLFQTDSAWCLLEFIVANPEVRRGARSQGFDALFTWAKAAAIAGGFKNIFSSVSSDPLIKRYVDNGFQITDRKMTNLVFKVED